MTDKVAKKEADELPEWARQYLIERERALITELRAIWDMMDTPHKIPKRRR